MFTNDDDATPTIVKSQESYQVFTAEARKYRIKYIRSLIAFFFLGVFNNFGSMVMLTAAEDIMEINTVGPGHKNYTLGINRHCSEVGTGAVLLAFIITATIVSSIIPFLPWFLHMRIFLSIILSMMGYCIVSLATKALTMALVGILLVSSAEVIGEISCLQYTTYFHANVISTWASGTGVADKDLPTFSQSGGEEDQKKNKWKKIRYIRSIIAFWILGTCNNFGVSAMLCGAVNIIEVNDNTAQNTPIKGKRDCTLRSTGIIIVAQYIGAVGTTLMAPFVPMLIHCRMMFCLLLYAAGFLLVAFITEQMEVAMVGVALVSISSALGEVTLLQYAAYFSRDTVSAFSSGTGAAGLLGALSYTLGVEKGYKYTMLGMITIPVLMGAVFWILLPIPTEEDKQSVAIQRAWNEGEVKTPWMIILKKSYLVPKVLYKYIAPLGSVYLFEYFINQGMYELIKVEDNLISGHMQYQWLQVAYQLGVFVSRSSVNCIYVKYIWIMTLFQFFNVVIFTTAAIYMYINNFWILFALAVEEGIFGGAAYVNTFVKIGREEVEEEKQFMSSMTCFGNNAGIMLAGLLAILAHNLICKLPPPSEL